MLETSIESHLLNNECSKNIFLGVFARDELPVIEEIKYPSCFVLNNQNRGAVGEHWLAIYYNENKKAFFFDSYGLNPMFYSLTKYLRETSNSWTYNQKRIQGESQYCGYYCIFYLISICRNETIKFFKHFSKNLGQNDQILSDIFEKNYNNFLLELKSI